MPIDDRSHLVEKQNIPMRLVIATDGAEISIPLLADVLMFLRTAYVLAWNADDQTPAIAFDVDDHFLSSGRIEEMVKRVQERLPAPLDALVIQSWGRVVLAPGQDLQLLDLTRENPLVLQFRGMALALATAVVLGGGKFQLGASGIKAELPGLGETIRNFRVALEPIRHEPRVPYDEAAEMTHGMREARSEREERETAASTMRSKSTAAPAPAKSGEGGPTAGKRAGSKSAKRQQRKS